MKKIWVLSLVVLVIVVGVREYFRPVEYPWGGTCWHSESVDAAGNKIEYSTYGKHEPGHAPAVVLLMNYNVDTKERAPAVRMGIKSNKWGLYLMNGRSETEIKRGLVVNDLRGQVRIFDDVDLSVFKIKANAVYGESARPTMDEVRAFWDQVVLPKLKESEKQL